MMKRIVSGFVLTVLCVCWSGLAAAKPPMWDTKKPKGRFAVLAPFNGEAVLDRETGLLWTKSPGFGSPCGLSASWSSALFCCMNAVVGGRLGWRLPSLQELVTLLDATASPADLPAGHPFTGVPGEYWTATSITANPANGVFAPVPYSLAFQAPKTDAHEYWCVRGPGGYDLAN